MASLQQMEAAIAKFPQDNLLAAFEYVQGNHASANRDWSAAHRHYLRAIELAGKRGGAEAQLAYVPSLIAALRSRGSADDHAEIDRLFAQWLPLSQEHEALRLLAPLQFRVRWERGEILAANEGYERWLTDHDDPLKMQFQVTAPETVEGEVLDRAGKPIEGATVVAGTLIGDSARLASHLHGSFVTTITDRHGRFVLPGATLQVAAQRQDDRSDAVPIASRVRLVLKPTTRVTGRVDHGKYPRAGVEVVIRRQDPRLLMKAPVLDDGSFTFAGVPRGTFQIELDGALPSWGQGQLLVVGDTPVSGVHLAASSRTVHVVNRTLGLEPLDGAVLYLARSIKKHEGRPRLADLRVLGHDAIAAFIAPRLGQPSRPLPPELAVKLEASDITWTFENLPEGPLHVCGFGLSLKQWATSTLQDWWRAAFKFELGCTEIASDASLVILELPPQQRLTPKSP